MIAESVIYALLNSAPGLTALVGTRIYFDTRPEDDALPAIVYELISDLPDVVLHPSEKEPCTARIQVTSFGQIAEDSLNVREQVRIAAHNKSGVIAGYSVIACFDGGCGADSYDHLVDVYSKPMDFIIKYLR